MAEEEKDKAAEGVALPGAEGGTDVLFQAQMGIFRFFNENWKTGATILGVVLAGALVYGLVDSFLTSQARASSAKIAEIDRKMPRPDPLAQYGLGPMDDPNDAGRMADLAEGARRYEEIAKGASGAAATEAWIKAAEAWTRAQKPDEAAKAWEQAAEGKGVLGYAGIGGAANAKLDKGDVDGAVALYRKAADGEGFIAEDALFKLRAIYGEAGKADEVKKVEEELGKRFATSAKVQLEGLAAPPAPVAPAATP